MSISFSCKSCGRSYSVSDSFAGKKAKCKDCGVEFRVPMPASTAPRQPARPPAVARPSRPVAPPVDDRFGFDDLPAPRPLYEVEDEPVLPRRAPATWKPRESSSRRSSDTGDSANSFCFGGFWTWMFGVVFVFATVVSMLQAKDGGSHWAILYLVGSGICCLGILAMTVGIVIAFVNLIRFREFPSVGIGGGLIWILALVLTPISLVGMVLGGVQGYNNAIALQNGRQGINPPPANILPPGFNNPPPGFNPPADQPPVETPPRLGPAQQEVRVALSNGRISKRTGPFNTPQMGVEFQVDYTIETGRAMGEKYVLMIRTSKSRGKLTTFHLRGSGTISGFSPIAAIEDGPFEAWMELESFAGRNSRKVSDSITLQVVQSSQPPNNPPGNPNGAGQNPGNRPGMPPGLPPRGNRGPRGFPGGRP